jgi:hypothetical protein
MTVYVCMCVCVCRACVSVGMRLIVDAVWEIGCLWIGRRTDGRVCVRIRYVCVCHERVQSGGRTSKTYLSHPSSVASVVLMEEATCDTYNPAERRESSVHEKIEHRCCITVT